jgi:hypothetical protein
MKEIAGEQLNKFWKKGQDIKRIIPRVKKGEGSKFKKQEITELKEEKEE